MLLRFAPALLAIALCGAPTAPAADAPRPWEGTPFLPLTAERIESLPVEQQPAWRDYLARSDELAAVTPAPSEPEFSPLKPLTTPPAGGKHTKGLALDKPDDWYNAAEAQTTADYIVSWQTPAGGWTKGINYSGPRPATAENKRDIWSRGTFDNEATIIELRFLAKVISATDATDPRVARWRDAFDRGLRYVFNAQYPNGGFPQIYPLGGGYHDAITFNDNAIGRILEFMSDIVAKKESLALASVEQREKAARAFERGIACILATQIVEDSGRRTVWGQQHDMLTLKPCAARNFEPISASAAESAPLTRLLMSLPEPTPEVVTAVDAAVTWFKKVALQDVIWDRRGAVGGLQKFAGAPLLWSRLYEINTDKPVFGDRDRTIHYVVEEISAERRLGYGWYADWPASVLKEYPKWRARVKR